MQEIVTTVHSIVFYLHSFFLFPYKSTSDHKLVFVCSVLYFYHNQLSYNRSTQVLKGTRLHNIQIKNNYQTVSVMYVQYQSHSSLVLKLPKDICCIPFLWGLWYTRTVILSILYQKQVDQMSYFGLKKKNII